MKSIDFLPATTRYQCALPSWVTQYTNSTSIVLDVGAGRGRITSIADIHEQVGRLVGVDPDPTIAENPYLDEWYCSTLEDFAKENSNQFDVLYSMMVLEHVTNPYTFFSTCRKLLKPGGMFFAVTPNLLHYFGMGTALTSRLGVNEWLLDQLIGKQEKEEYHFPTFYKINSIRTIRGILKQTGFDDVEFMCFDNPREFYYVIPQPLHWFPRIYSQALYSMRLPQYMGRIMFRAII